MVSALVVFRRHVYASCFIDISHGILEGGRSRFVHDGQAAKKIKAK